MPLRINQVLCRVRRWPLRNLSAYILKLVSIKLTTQVRISLALHISIRTYSVFSGYKNRRKDASDLAIWPLLLISVQKTTLKHEVWQRPARDKTQILTWAASLYKDKNYICYESYISCSKSHVILAVPVHCISSSVMWLQWTVEQNWKRPNERGEIAQARHMCTRFC